MPASLLDPDAWRGYRMDRFPGQSWAVEAGVLRAIPGADAVSLVSRERFADFSLVFEWRLAPGGNSGVLYRVSEDGEAPWETGLEMQLLDDAGHPDGRVPDTRCGALYGLCPREVDATGPPGVFNEGRIRVRGDEVEHWLNGVRVLRFTIGTEAFVQRLGRSKFAHCPLFAKEKRGHLVLQHHGDEAWFRNLRLE